MELDVAQKDHLLAAAALGVATLLLCVLAELLDFASRRHAALFLVPVCGMLLLWRFSGRAAMWNEMHFALLVPASSVMSFTFT